MQRSLDEVAGLHEHAGRAARRVVHDAVIGFDDVDDHANQGGRREELAAFLRAGLGELIEEILVDATEHVAAGLGERWTVEDLDQLGQQGRLEPEVFLGQGARQHLLAFAVLHRVLDQVHRTAQRLADLAALGQVGQVIPPGFGRQVDGRLALEAEADAFFPHGPRQARVQAGFNLGQNGLKTVECMAQEDQAQHGHGVLARGEFGVGAQLVGGFPEFVFDLLQVAVVHRGGAGSFAATKCNELGGPIARTACRDPGPHGQINGAQCGPAGGRPAAQCAGIRIAKGDGNAPSACQWSTSTAGR